MNLLDFENKGKMMNKVNVKYAIRRTAIGLGFFALESIPKGKRLIEYTGPFISNEEVEQRRGKYFFGVNTKWSIDGSPRSNIARYINHSCRPSAEALISGRRVWIWSRRNIKPGEEITYDYGKEYFEDIIKPVGCKCEKCVSRPGSRTTRRPRRLKRRRIGGGDRNRTD
jgi:SET domain-containing protein